MFGAPALEKDLLGLMKTERRSTSLPSSFSLIWTSVRPSQQISPAEENQLRF